MPSVMNSNGGEICAKLRCLIPDKQVNSWLADHKVTR